MLKVIIAALLAVSVAACDQANSKPPHVDRTAAESDPCDEGYSFDKSKGVCFRELEKKLHRKEACRVGEIREFRQPDGRIIVRRCAYTK